MKPRKKLPKWERRSPDELLALSEVTKRFGGLTAVDQVSFDVGEGRVMGLIGPNGAGKTTIFNLITGNYENDEGEIVFGGRRIDDLPTHVIVSLGIARTFQTIRLFQNMSVIDNVLAGCHCRMKSGVLSAVFRGKAQQKEEAWALDHALEQLRIVSLRKRAADLAGNLAYGNQRLLEIARALASNPKLLILDEPAGGMNEQETDSLIGLIDRLRDTGLTILLIEHDMGLVMKACDDIVVVEYGKKIAEGNPGEICNNPKVIEAYLGTDEDV